MRTFTIEDIKPFLGNYELKGNPDDKTFTEVAPASNAHPGTLVWINKGKQAIAEETKSKLILCPPSIIISADMEQSKCYIIVDNPKQVFARIVEGLFKPADHFYGIHPSSVIHPEAVIHENVAIGAFCIIDKCTIGEGTQIRDFCKIHGGVRIGKNVNIYEHCNLGGAGFGFAVDNSSGTWRHFPHIGGLEIEDNVELFPYVNIDRGTLGNTKIGTGTKIDHYCHIGHNSVIGNNCIITAQVVFCGSSRIGSNSWVGVGSIIKQSVQIGNKVTIGIGSVVTKDIPDSETWIGSPARKIDEFLKIQGKIKDLL
jgi:UDP-3-O-[3-hydroxymyristoyl] glucosamine N-acyltransferase